MPSSNKDDYTKGLETNNASDTEEVLYRIWRVFLILLCDCRIYQEE